jgi:chromosome segregation ATPase
MPDVEHLGPIVSWLSLAWTIALTLYLAVWRSDDALRQRIEKTEGDLNGFGERITRFEERVNHTLTREHLNVELSKLYDELKKTRQEAEESGKLLAKVEGKLEALNGLVIRMDDFWRTHGK